MKKIFQLLNMLFIFTVLLGWKSSFGMEVEELVIKNGSSSACIKLQVADNSPQIVLIDQSGQERLVLQVDDIAKILVNSESKEKGLELSVKDEGSFALFDKNGKNKMTASPTGVILKNDNEKVVGSFSILADGSGGFGLADAEGFASAIVRGGANPCFALFGNKPDPIAALGIMQQIPHLIVSGNVGNEGVLIHGGEHSGLMVLNETGQLKVFINKDGIFQNQQQTGVEEKPKFFSFSDERKLLFPNDHAQEKAQEAVR